MPKIRKNVIRKPLNNNERAEFEALGYTEEQIDQFNEILKQDRWDFWSKASELYLSLAAGSDITFANGKARTVDSVTSAKFTSNFFSTADRNVARLIFMSDPYMNKRVRLVSDHVEDEAQTAYKEFKTKILSSKENVARLKEELAAL